eukprot:TRINITY_DN11681_c0_g3_i1.p1 TRINITY_DN11681_c0_g3~~TRINITY_DN11681_c0_g3_i1.p1  ORF type:complete len:148 (+),score=56.64 TRINITY_DN11681_c0_g3_i1:83-526(+)
MSHFTHGIWGNWIERRIEKEEAEIMLDGYGSKNKLDQLIEEQNRARKERKEKKKLKKEKKERKRARAGSMSGNESEDDGKARKANKETFWSAVDGWDDFSAVAEKVGKKQKKGKASQLAAPDAAGGALAGKKRKRESESDDGGAAEC